MKKKIFVTGGSGFIGSAFVRKAVGSDYQVLNFDKLTYAVDPTSLESVEGNKNYQFVRGDICDEAFLEKTLNNYLPDYVVHFAAESHVDNSIHSPGEFIQTNVVGTFHLVKICHELQKKNKELKFIHVSTDEVYGDLKIDEPKFSIYSRYKPSSPYAASKASSDHIVQAWFRTYGFSSMMTHCSNNYGPFQNREKFIPTVILNAIHEKPIPIYGKGENIRDWIHVHDHIDALFEVMNRGSIGQTYNIGGNFEMKNIELAQLICLELDQMKPRRDQRSYQEQIVMVTDRLGHDQRYAIDNSHIETTLGWKPKIQFKDGIKQTIEWYVRKYV